MIFRNKELNNLKVRRFLKSKSKMTETELESLLEQLQEFYKKQVNLRVSYFVDGVTEYEYSKIRKIDLKRGVIKLKNKTKIAIDDIEEVKEL